MANIWEKYDSKVDLAGFEEDVKEADEKGGDFADLPLGKYEVALTGIELKETKESKKPMIVSAFTVVDGEFENRLVWVNQVVEKPGAMAMGLRFVNAMKPESEIKFTKDGGYAQLAEDLEAAGAYIPDNHEFVLDISKNKEFTNYKIDTVFNLVD